MKDNVETPGLVVDITLLSFNQIGLERDSVVVGALARMSDVADHALIRAEFPAVSQALLDSASPQLRNMATIGGNLLQRTRCAYFRDTAVPCNKRVPGSGCAARDGVNRLHAVLGTSERCICVHPSDLAVAMLAAGARVRSRGPAGERTIPLDEFYVLPHDRPERENVLGHGEMIVGVELPRSNAARHSAYLKLRDRASYEFALVSVAAGLEVANGTIQSARLALGGVAPIPWRSAAAELMLTGRPATDATYAAAAATALAGARGYGQNNFKIELARRAIVSTLRRLGASA